MGLWEWDGTKRLYVRHETTDKEVEDRVGINYIFCQYSMGEEASESWVSIGWKCFAGGIFFFFWVSSSLSQSKFMLIRVEM